MRAALAALLCGALAACGVLPASRAPERPRSSAGTAQPGISRPDAGKCLAALGASGARYAPLPDRFYAPGCQAVGSVRLDRLAGDQGQFTLANLGPVACPLAQAFAAWARYGVDRAARQMLGSPLARIETMGSYACRNIASGTRLSAHSRAEAIDVGAFVLADGRRVTVKAGWNGASDQERAFVLADGRRVSVKAGWNGASDQERAFLRTVHTSACKRFGTVLGPAYNAAHADHLHVELGDGSFCR